MSVVVAHFQSFKIFVAAHFPTLKLSIATTVKPLIYDTSLAGNKFVDHSDVVGASPVGAAPTTSSFST